MSTNSENIRDFARKYEDVFGSGKRTKQKPADSQSGPDNDAKSSAATQAVDIIHATNAELWHTAGREAYLTVMDDQGIVSHMAIQSSDCSEWIGLLFYRQTGKAIAGDAVKSAQNLLAAEAKFSGPETPVFSRVAHQGNEIYVDIGSPSWQAVRIDPDGWTIVASGDVPVRFCRSRSSLSLPLPERGGSLESLRIIFPNIDDAEWMLLKGFLFGCFQADGARAFLELIGGQGSGKSTLARYVACLIDPSDVPLRAMPKDEQALLIATIRKSLLGLDNISHIPTELADGLCRISTGAGLGSRALYSDKEEVLIKAQVPSLWTCIEPQAIRRPDLQDRTISLRLDPLDESTYRSEREIDEAFKEIQPQLLGALYSAISCALAHRDTIQFDRLPRLADFCLWVESAAESQDWQPGAFIDVFEASRAVASAMAVDASPIGTLLIEFMSTRKHWEGPASELLTELKALADDDARRNRSFPRDPTRLSGQLRRLQRPLVSMGIWVGFNRSKHSRDIVLDRNDTVSGTQSASGQDADSEAF